MYSASGTANKIVFKQTNDMITDKPPIDTGE